MDSELTSHAVAPVREGLKRLEAPDGGKRNVRTPIYTGSYCYGRYYKAQGESPGPFILREAGTSVGFRVYTIERKLTQGLIFTLMLVIV